MSNSTNKGDTMKNSTIDLGNNESAKIGVFAQSDGTFLALTRTASKEFKTEIGAIRWLANRIAIRRG